MRGEHWVSADRAIVVEDVEVLPQPVGAYCDVCYAPGQRPAELGDSYTLVFDPGFYSVDWVVMHRHHMRDSTSGSSRIASCEIIGTAAHMIAMENGRSNDNAEQVEEALRTGRNAIQINGRYIDILPTVERAARGVSDRVVNELLNKMRNAGHDIDRVLLVGGGASYYERALREAFPKAQFIGPAEPVLSNARGFYFFGRQAVKKKAAA
jgi:plasmid segregation protein ParM